MPSKKPTKKAAPKKAAAKKPAAKKSAAKKVDTKKDPAPTSLSIPGYGRRAAK
jgi:hypothetical protein